MLPAYISHSDCIKHEMGDQHPECPERIGAVNDQLLIKGLLDYMQPYDAPLATEHQLAQAHSSLYIHELAAQVPTEGYAQIDPDTKINKYSYQAALRAAGAAVLATDLVITGKAPVGFCNVRPPGHHAERAAAGGFCFFNNVVVGIRHALNEHGLERVALIDFDVHHGNGSEDILYDDPRVLMCSIFEEGLYPFCGGNPRGANMINVGLPTRSCSAPFREAVETGWLPALEAFKPRCCSSRPASTPTARTTWATSGWSRPTMNGSRASWCRWPRAIARAASCPASKAATCSRRWAAARPRT